MKTADTIRLSIFTVLFGMALAILLTLQGVSASLKTLDSKMETGGTVVTHPPQTQFLISPSSKEKGVNPYFQGFFRDYGDGEIHPHRQALMLLLSHLAASGEHPVENTETIVVDPEKKD